MKLEELNLLKKNDFLDFISKWPFGEQERELIEYLQHEYKLEDQSLLFSLLFLFHLKNQSYVSLNLSRWENQFFYNELSSLEERVGIQFPALSQWKKQILSLSNYEADGVRLLIDEKDFGADTKVNVGSFKKSLLVFSTNSLYLRKNYFYETMIASRMGALIRLSSKTKNTTELTTENQQLKAVGLSLWKKFLIISGGPGTGKTHTIFQIAKKLLLSQIHPNKIHTIKLLAPTGKAVYKLQSAFSEQLEKEYAEGSLDKVIKLRLDQILVDSATIHRFLTSDPRKIESSSSKNANGFSDSRKIFYDTVIVDESSMLSLEILYQLFTRVEDSTQIILIGDKDQLPPVENGFIFADLLRAVGEAKLEEVSLNLKESIVILDKNYRVKTGSKLAELIGKFQKNKTITAHDFIDKESNEISLMVDYDLKTLKNWWNQYFLPHYENWFIQFETSYQAENLDEMKTDWFRQLNQRIILCSHRQGELGVENINKHIYHWLVEAGKVNLDPSHYPGEVIMINQNDYQNELFNGDIGIFIKVEGKLMLMFEGKSTLFSSFQLPSYESFYSTTIHKSQGSEFNEILVVFPEENKSQDQFSFLTRELVYTALTRSREKASLMMEESLLMKMLERKVDRDSKLFEKVCNNLDVD